MSKGNYQYDTIARDTAVRDTAVQDRALPTGIATPDTAPLLTRLRARVAAARLDRETASGAVATPGSLLDVHMARLTSVREREGVARAFRHLLDVSNTRSRALLRVPMLSSRIIECRGVVDDITMRLHSPRPVRAEGVARLRMLLSDGTGPMYCDGDASLDGELRGALAAL